MEPEDHELLRQLLRRPFLAIAVIVDGEPCAGLVPFLADRDGTGFVVHVSALARHTNGLGEGARVSAVVHLEPYEDPLRIPRLHLEGSARVVARDADEHAATAVRWLAAFPTSGQTLTLSDFRFVHVAVDRGRLVAGFGKAFGLSARAIRDIVQPPVA